jgi:diguanylate cyclase (GGDEF)-like protein
VADRRGRLPELAAVSVAASETARVLVVDDEPHVRHVVMRILKRAGHSAEGVGSAREAYEHLSGSDFDVVMCDLRLGGSDGLDLIRMLAARASSPAVVALTGVADPAVVRQALIAGASAYVTKPFRATDIEIAVQQALRRREVDEDAALRRSGLERELRYRADFDPLTGLFNRRRFVEELGRYLEICEGTGRRGALLLCDLDHFKLVNDSLGHAAGDAVLRRAAGIIQGRLRESSDTAARLDGDEFAILLPDVDPVAALSVAGQLRRLLADPAAKPSTGASIGVAPFDGRDGLTRDDLMVAADIALYDAKEAGRDTVALYRGPRASSRGWVDRIRSALQDDRLVMYTQPIVDLRTGQVSHEELLVRMLETSGELVGPCSFLPTAERFGLIEEIDAWVLDRALELTAAGRAVNVNISAKTMQRGALVETIAERARAGVDPRLLTVEITETMAVSNMDHVRVLAGRLAALGCGLALDDFGTGFGTFTYLKYLPITTIKIDREFVTDVARSRSDQRMIKAIVEIARAAGQTTVAEGVEDAAALELLRGYGVDFAQGYHLAPPTAVGTGPPQLEARAEQLHPVRAA